MPKISALPPMTTADAADEQPIVDDSAGTTKKWTLTLLKTYLQSLAAWITTAMITDANVTPAKLSAADWFKHLPGYAYSTVVAGTWTALGTTGTGGIGSVAIGGSNGAINEEVQFKAVLLAGTYKLYLYCDTDINRGIYTISVNGSSVGTYDAYSATRVAGVVATISSSIVVATSGLVTINVKMASKNASSSGYYARMYELLFVRTA